MITIDGVNNTNCLWGLSTEEKPTKANGKMVPNATIGICIDDTSKAYVYDKENDKWGPVR